MSYISRHGPNINPVDDPSRPGAFSKWAKPELLPDLIPIIPPGAALSEHSKVDPRMTGKIPGRYLGNGEWCGFGDWTKFTATEADIAEWATWPDVSIGLQTRNHPAVDIDCTDQEIAEKVEKLAFDILGPAPVRVGNAPKRLLLYRGPPMTKQTVKFESEGNAVEVLAKGQQFVVEGIHPKTGRPYTWNIDPVTFWPEIDLTEVTEAQVAVFLAACAELAPVKAKSTATSTEHREAAAETISVDLDNLPQALRSLAIDAIECELAREDGEPKEHQGSDDRAYKLAARLGDLSSNGARLSPKAIAALLKQHWAPRFNLSWLLVKARSASKHRQNGAGCDDPAATFDPYLQSPRKSAIRLASAHPQRAFFQR
jgi:hypothetical protein